MGYLDGTHGKNQHTPEVAFINSWQKTKDEIAYGAWNLDSQCNDKT